MSLKDWRLTTKVRFDEKYEDWYTNQTNGDKLIIQNASTFTQAKSGWSVFCIYTTNPTRKYFKSESQALIYAKNFMRTH
jgi:hypothetical protein